MAGSVVMGGETAPDDANSVRTDGCAWSRTRGFATPPARGCDALADARISGFGRDGTVVRSSSIPSRRHETFVLPPPAVGCRHRAGRGATPVQARLYDGFVVFGDSLSDSGNNALAGLYDPTQVVTGNTYVPSATYAPAMTYTNGPVWATYFGSLLGVPILPSLAGGTDFAFGGAPRAPRTGSAAFRTAC